ncbi:YcxB family protein [Desulforhopalus sp. IMCC35007]|uniref:YcxB family protein n=1 Tax=Desulforhopalus sp. IMCC35007 TaxID=2569543 RepID=UPI0010AE79EC|nr:YcxB family protein [Desulforhopalus sp. IMCC35007]TKB05668.1 YcxB family protein [Desulforhopalus sp. IMCC35007]
MEIQVTLQKEDWKLYQSYIEKELPKHLKTWMDSFWVNMLIWMVIAFGFLLIFNQYSSFHWPTAISVGAFFISISALFLFNMFKIRKAFEPSDEGTFCGNHTFIFDEHGINSEGEGYKGIHSWAIVKKIERVQGMILIYLDTAYAYVFPESKISDPDGFYNYISEQHSKVTSQASGTPKSGALS